MRILVIDDSQTNLVALRSLLEVFGYTVTTARDGVEGVAEFERDPPDIVLMDIMMPNMDGYEATRAIKKRCGGRYIPVIFVTSLTGTDDLVRGIEAGGDDFIARPFDAGVLRAKLTAFRRVIGVHANLLAHERAMAEQNKRLSLEMRIGQTVLAKITGQGLSNPRMLRHWIFPMGVFCGDLLLSARTPSGGVIILLGDITGHGLSAAIGAQPVADIFYGMSAKGFSIGDIVGEINRRVYSTLHPEIFCAACLVELDPERTTATVWNGAMPDVFVVNTATGEQRRVKSSHQALGVIPDDKFDRRTEILSIGEHDRIFLFSDGFIEAKDQKRQRFGQARTAQFFENLRDWSAPIDGLKQSLLAFLGTVSPGDDVSVVEIICAAADTAATDPGQLKQQNAKPSRWHAEVTLFADSIQACNPVPVITGLIMQVQSPLAHRERIFTVVSELVTNAVDHGLLGLESSLKSGPEGFVRYFQARAVALAALKSGWVRIELNHEPDGDRGMLTIRVEDSGSGFDVAAFERRQGAEKNEAYSGRGIGLVRRLCGEARYNGRGNAVEATYLWTR